MRNYQTIYNEWLNSDLLTIEEKDELLAIKDNDDEIKDRFFQDLAFGTGGLRGVMGLGTNRMNRFIIRKATQGLANFLNKKYQNPCVAIAYDSRNHSAEYAKETAIVLASNGIKAYLTRELMPTPFLSFMTRYYHCQAGVVVTASHNSKIYNGYKVYGEDGCQCTNFLADSVLNEILALDTFNDVKIGNFATLVEQGKICLINDDCFDAFIASTLKQSIYQENKVLNVIYTPLNGAGRKCVTTILNKEKFNYHVVKEQEMPDGNFPTCPFPNPEIHDALKLAIDKMIDENADIIVATDPDSDRCGVVVNVDKKPHILTGNEVGLLLFDALYNARKVNNTLTNRPVLVKTIVSSDMASVMAKDYGVTVIEVLTGFKYIGEQILYLEQKDCLNDYLFGFEESCGYLSNTDVRDKDAVNAVLLICELANHLKLQGQNLLDRLNYLYNKYGDFKTALLTYEFPGVSGMQKIKDLMSLFRSDDVKNSIEGLDYLGDYKEGFIYYKNNKVPTNLPSSDVVKYFLIDKSTITVRPSGTEPKLKIYIFAEGQKRVDELKTFFNDLVNK